MKRLKKVAQEVIETKLTADNIKIEEDITIEALNIETQKEESLKFLKGTNIKVIENNTEDYYIVFEYNGIKYETSSYSF